MNVYLYSVLSLFATPCLFLPPTLSFDTSFPALDVHLPQLSNLNLTGPPASLMLLRSPPCFSPFPPTPP